MKSTSCRALSAIATIGALALLCAGQASKTDLGERRARILQVAESYVRHTWSADKVNVFHGLDAEGVRVDTPDSGYVKGGFKTDGSANVGVPYQWGGFSSLTEFDEGVRAKQYAGHSPAGENADASYHAVGVDCSGFVSRCWNLPFKRSTNTLPAICYELADYSELQPGDIVDRAKHHVMLFKEFTSPEKTAIRIYEADIPVVHETTVTLEELRTLGYRPMRYKPLDPRWRDDALTLAPATLNLTHAENPPRWSQGKPTDDAEAWSKLADPLRSARRGEWVTYDATYVHPLRPATRAYTLRFGCARASETQAELSICTALGDASEELVEDRVLHATNLDSLLALFLEIEVVDVRNLTTTAELGRLTFQKQNLPVTRHTVEFDARLYSKDGTRLHVEMQICTSERVPMHGVVDANFKLRLGSSEKPLEIEHHFTLSAARKE